MAHNVVAADAFLITEKGPALATLVERDDRVLMADRNGQLVLCKVSKVKALPATSGWRLLTDAGDVVLLTGALALTSAGPLAGAEVEKALRRGQGVSLDIVSPEDLPSPKPASVPVREVYRSCLAALPAGVIQLPCGNGIAEAIAPGVVKMLKAAKVKYRSVEDDRWLALVFEPVEGTARGARAEFELQAEALAMVTAWAGKAERLESRVRVGDCELRRRLLAAAAGAGRPFSVKWHPGYSPVESRMRIGDGRPWRARAAVHAAARVSDSALAIDTRMSGDLVVSLAVLRPERAV
jgi:hypothetical protein